ncbi:RNA-binding region-containing protein 3-like [Ptychodera flava]|uniref:RNA-binding region-containing protein 3-like n=1 Tax=Ptychodera flava TaxID=63121 RepID=UPI003969F89A
MKNTEDHDTLLVRHLPSILSQSEKEELLRHFGADDVKCMCDKGPMKHAAIAKFSDSEAASKALSRLHQLKILDQRLVVEYANKLPTHLLPSVSIDSKYKDIETDKKKAEREEEKQELNLQDHIKEHSKRFAGISPLFGINYSSNPLLRYHYPPPTREILTNIMHTLASVPKFYIQVLHLMNKMNLPPPFGPLTSEPPLHSGTGIVGEDEVMQMEMQIASSEEESELESDEDERRERLEKQKSVKRPHPQKKTKPRKKPKLQQLLQLQKPAPPSTVSQTTYKPADVFESTQQQQIKKMEFNLSETVLQKQAEDHAYPSEPAQREIAQETETSGFGKIEPVNIQEDEDNEEEAGEVEIMTEFISSSELKKNRLSKEELRKYSAFKKYEPGEPTSRLFVKNLSKQTDEKDLRYIFGRYIDFSSELESDMFDVRLMDGRMKGQAFIGLPNESKAKKALEETNAYLLHGKPIVVQFARSAKPKEKDTKK